MLCLYLASFAFILYTDTVQGGPLEQEIMIEQKTNGSKGSTSLQALVEKQNSLNEELLKVLNRIDSKLDSISSHKIEPEKPMKDGSNNENDIQIFSNCTEALMKTNQNGIYNMTLRNYRLPFPVYCDAETFGGNWTVIQRRQDGSVDFYRNWTEYQNGFGNLNGEFFIGLDKLHALTEDFRQELLIELEDFENEIRYAKYDAFTIGGEAEDYAINVLGNYSGDAGDCLEHHKNMKFTTKDRDNDNWPTQNCANRSKSGWWFDRCQYCNLNGVYSRNSTVKYEQGINWYPWKEDWYSLKSARMLIRPKIVSNLKQ